MSRSKAHAALERYVSLAPNERVAALQLLASDEGESLDENPNRRADVQVFIDQVVAASAGRGLQSNRTADHLALAAGISTEAAATCLSELSSVPDVYLQEKGRFLSYCRDRLYIGSRAFIDIRPVFLDSASGLQPRMLVVSHELRIEVKEDNRDREYSFHLDLDDLDDLIRVLEHAKIKHRTLQDSME